MKAPNQDRVPVFLYRMLGSFSSVTWLMIIGVILFCVGCFVPASTTDMIFRIFDVRLWPWWYFPCVALMLFFFWRWMRFVISLWGDHRSVVYEVSPQFLRLSGVVFVELLLLILLNATGVLSKLWWPVYQMFIYGVFSWMVLGVLTLGFIAIVAALWCLKDWLLYWFFLRHG